VDPPAKRGPRTWGTRRTPLSAEVDLTDLRMRPEVDPTKAKSAMQADLNNTVSSDSELAKVH